jgi:hypothetical protein
MSKESCHMNTALAIALPAPIQPLTRRRARATLPAPQHEHHEPGQHLLDRFEPGTPYFSHSASAAEIARARGASRLSYDAV